MPLPPPLALPNGFGRTAYAKRPADWEALRSFLASAELPWERAIEGRRVAQWGCRYDYEKQCVDFEKVAEISEALRKIFPEALRGGEMGCNGVARLYTV